MRRFLAVAALTLPLLAASACASDVVDGVNEARSSAASIGSDIRGSAASVGSGVRTSCRASKTQLATLDDLSGKLADNADLRDQLAPQVRSTVDQLATRIGDRTELQPVVAAGRDLTKALGDANETTVEVSARQAQVAVRSAQAVCKVAG
jgi:opacity protein-like surface antigen